MRWRWRRGVGLGGAALAIVACSSVKDCTEIGCVGDGPTAIVEAPPGVADVNTGELTVCVGDQDCVVSGFAAGTSFLDVAIAGAEDGDVVVATLAMPDGTKYEAAGQVRSSRPNGPGCDPVCTRVDLHLA